VTSIRDKGIDKPVRQCALRRKSFREDELLRFVLDPSGSVVPDIKRKLPGRGVWISANYDDVAQAVSRKVFSRSFKTGVSADAHLADLTGDLLKKAALGYLSIANKAGLIISGFAKTEKAIKSRNILNLIHAIDAARDGTEKLDRLARAVWGPQENARRSVSGFSSTEISTALGKVNVNHAAIADGPAGRTFIRSADRYIGYMGTHLAARSMAGTPEQEKA
jgi:predicted RNA-binding protein YlxR (DUF448 family)